MAVAFALERQFSLIGHTNFKIPLRGAVPTGQSPPVRPLQRSVALARGKHGRGTSIYASMIVAALGALTLLIWLVLLFARGWFWTDHSIRQCAERIGTSLSIAVIIPARDEADLIGPVIESLLTQQCDADLHVILADDQSSDATPEQALAVASRLNSDRFTVINVSPVPRGWKGKMWALHEGLQAAESLHPDYYLFADADIVHGPDSVQSLIACAEAGGFDLVSCMIKLRCESFAERLLIPAFTFFFFMLYPPRWVADKRSSTAAAAGGCALVRAAALDKIGGIAAIHGALIDDCALAGAVKRSGGAVWLGQTAATRSIRPYGSFGEISRLISRTAFTQLNHSILLLLGTVLALSVTYLLPPALIFAGGRAAVLGGCAWALMSIAYWPTLRFYKLSPLWAPVLPVVALFYMIATLQSAIDYWQGRGGRWKGRIQDPMRAS